MKLLLIVGLSTLAVASAKNKECYDWNSDPLGENYRGKQTTAKIARASGGYHSGMKARISSFHNLETTCQKWSEDWPNKNNVGYHEEHNYCRNPDGDKNGPWCLLNGYSPNYVWNPWDGFWYTYNSRELKKNRPIANYGYCKSLIPQCENKTPPVLPPENWTPPIENSGSTNSCYQPDPRGKCFVSSQADKEFEMPYFTESDNRLWCRSKCKSAGFCFAGAETPEKTWNGEKRLCKCFNDFSQEKSSNCNRWCSDYNQNKFCGGGGRADPNDDWSDWVGAMNVWKV